MSDPHARKDPAEKDLEAYLAQVRRHLLPLPAEESREAIDELRSHVRDRAGGEGLTAGTVAEALAALGDPRSLAGLHLAERAAVRAETQRQPWRVLASIWRLTGFSLAAVWTLLVAGLGYATGLFLVAAAAMKPIWPDNVGFWVRETPRDDIAFSIGRSSAPTDPEILGFWIIPIGLVLGGLILFLTWRFSLAGLRRLGRGWARVLS